MCRFKALNPTEKYNYIIFTFDLEEQQKKNIFFLNLPTDHPPPLQTCQYFFMFFFLPLERMLYLFNFKVKRALKF